MTSSPIDKFEALSTEETAALSEAVDDDPGALREWLVDEGYLDPATIDHGRDEEPADDLTEPQERLLELVERMGQPRSAGEVVEYVESEVPEFSEQYSSAKHRTWMNQQLNDLVDAGLIGRYRKGRTVKYTPSVKDAIGRWALEQSRYVEELERGEAAKIADETGMPRGTVRRALVSMLDSDG